MKPHSSRKETRRGWLGNWWGGSKNKKATNMEEKENAEVMGTVTTLGNTVSDTTTGESTIIEKNLEGMLNEKLQIQRSETSAEKTTPPSVVSENIVQIAFHFVYIF